MNDSGPCVTAEELRFFSGEIAEEFNAGRIRAPVHLDGGNEDALVRVFADISRADWVCGSWRMMFKCLLHGVPRETVREAVMRGRSITLCFPEHRVVSSAIVGGIIPIALGIAWEEKRAGSGRRVHVFSGDMTERTGMFDECLNYAAAFILPIRFVCERNGKSVCTDTQAAWGPRLESPEDDYVTAFSYNSVYPHSGAGVRVNF